MATDKITYDEEIDARIDKRIEDYIGGERIEEYIEQSLTSIYNELKCIEDIHARLERLEHQVQRLIDFVDGMRAKG